MPKILVVDDSETVRAILSNALEEDGYDVSVAASGLEALAQVQVSPPDVILLDVEMPGMMVSMSSSRSKQMKRRKAFR